jgi:hypothetical protein
MKGTLMKTSIANDNLPTGKNQESHPMAVELRVWWIPQVPMESFHRPVPDLPTAKLLVEALAQYDLFQFKHNIKPDYDNAGGASWRHPELTEGEWYDFDPEIEDEYQEVEAAIAKSIGQ